MPFLATLEGQFAFGRPPPATQINTSNLQIWVDAGTNSSYPGSGTVWSNLVTANAATYWYNLSNGPPTVSTIVFNGTSNRSLFFDGANDYATPNISLLPLAEVNNWNETREYWLYWPGAPGGLTMESGVAGPPDTNWFDAQASVSNANLVFSVWQGNVSMTPYIITNSFTSNAWNHVIWQHSKSSNLMMGYVNGVRLFSNAAVSRQTPSAGFFPILMAGSSTNYGYGSGSYLRGSLGIYRWYNQILTPSQVSSNYNAEKARFGAP